jgi:hypothetical protein
MSFSVKSPPLPRPGPRPRRKAGGFTFCASFHLLSVRQCLPHYLNQFCSLIVYPLSTVTHRQNFIAASPIHFAANCVRVIRYYVFLLSKTKLTNAKLPKTKLPKTKLPKNKLPNAKLPNDMLLKIVETIHC